MADHKSALKRNRQSEVRRARNRSIRTVVRTHIKAVNVAVDEQALEKAQEALKLAIPVIMKAASKGTYKQKNASRKVSRLTIMVNKLAAA